MPTGAKPQKPYPDFPLYAHNNGQWAKRVWGKLHYFGPWADPQEALSVWLRMKDDLLAGRPVVREGKPTVRNLLNAFIACWEQRAESGEISRKTVTLYYQVCKLVVAHFGATRPLSSIGPEDFRKFRAALSRRWEAGTLAVRVQNIRTIFKFAADELQAPVRLGAHFKKPPARVIRQVRNAKPPRLFLAEEVRRLLSLAQPQLHSMLLLGVNCALGATDCGLLPLSAVDLERGWLDYDRVKTGVRRRCPLWPETVASLREHLAARPDLSPDGKQLVFSRLRRLPRGGNRWDISHVMKRLLTRAEITRPGVGFYALRHCFQTIGERTRDFPAVAAIMGHVPASNDMSAFYRHLLVPEEEHRLREVTDCVRRWLFELET